VRLARQVTADVAAEQRPVIRVVVKIRYTPFFTSTHGHTLAAPVPPTDEAALGRPSAGALAALELSPGPGAAGGRPRRVRALTRSGTRSDARCPGFWPAGRPASGRWRHLPARRARPRGAAAGPVLTPALTISKRVSASQVVAARTRAGRRPDEPG
jgi:hypothetical protein